MEHNFINIILRLVHIFCAVFWAGAIIYMSAFILPASKAIPEGNKFMQQLSNTNRLPLVMMLASTLSIISGCILFWKVSMHLNSDWMATKMGIYLSAGGTAAILAYLIGLTVNMPTVNKIAKIGKQIAGGAPSAEQIQIMNGLRNRIVISIKVTAWLLAISVACMSVARYM